MFNFVIKNRLKLLIVKIILKKSNTNNVKYYICKAYHSRFTTANIKLANMAVLPLRTQVKGPAPRETNRTFIVIKIDDSYSDVFLYHLINLF